MLNILDLGFLCLAGFTLCTGYIIKVYGNYIPAFIIRSFKYGSFSYTGSGGSFVALTELPKAFFKHFYAFASIFSVTTLVHTVCVYLFTSPVNKYYLWLLKLLLDQNEPTVSACAALLAVLLLVAQCLRRCYETYHLQVFSKAAKMNLVHYMVGFFHYFGVIVGAIGEVPLFCGHQNRNQIQWLDTKTTFSAVPCLLIFAWMWNEQFRANIILANLRKDKKSGEVVTEDYKVPYGRLFNYVSSPHRFCEILIYLVLLVLIPTKTYFFIFLWVVSNQIFGAIYTHDWYKDTFKDYPQNRKAIFPGLL